MSGVVFRSSVGDITAISVADGGSLTVGESQLVGADGSSSPFPCDGTLPDCAGAHDGSVVVNGPVAITLASPLVCNVGTGECLSVRQVFAVASYITTVHDAWLQSQLAIGSEGWTVCYNSANDCTGQSSCFHSPCDRAQLSGLHLRWIRA